MGVTGLWTVVQPCARPIKLETLNKKRLAVDASIWIYQFLKAVRDKEGNALRNSHVVGFFRRICKLLYFGIKPVFVFDGGAPILKRQTIAARKSRREGRQEDAIRTAGKLLAVQMQRIAEEEVKRKGLPRHEEEESDVPDEPAYVDEIFMTEREKRRNRFRKTDNYHLPELDTSLEEMGAPDDPRIMSQEELEEYARQFHSGEDINLYDFSKIDFDGQFFLSLPASDRYNILNAARLRSRLRMGYSKDQLDSMFPDRLAFSKFQIERVKERNDLTQRLMNLNGMNRDNTLDGFKAGHRIAGERGKEYVLVKNSDVEGGWALGVVGNKNAGQRARPIDVDMYGQQEIFSDNENEWEADGDAFEDVPIEGLNRLPKLPIFRRGIFDGSIEQYNLQIAEEERPVYAGRREATTMQSSVERNYEDDSLFVKETSSESHQRTHEHRVVDNLFGMEVGSEDGDLRLAIEMSLESPGAESFEDVTLNNAIQPAFEEHVIVSTPETHDTEVDFTSALAQSRRSQTGLKAKPAAPHFSTEGFPSGPLPFEPLKVRSLSGEPLPREMDPDQSSGGFDRKQTGENCLPLPPWFTGGEETKKGSVADEITKGSPELYRSIEADSRYTLLMTPKRTEAIDADKIPDSEETIALVRDGEGSQAKLENHVVEPSPAPISQTIPVITMNSFVTSPDLKQRISAPISISRTRTVSKDEEVYDWELTDEENSSSISTLQQQQPAIRESPMRKDQSPLPSFEYVQIQQETNAQGRSVDFEVNMPPNPDSASQLLTNEANFSDPEDEDFMRQLAAEAEEHARFASTLNNKSLSENTFDFEQELRQLRAQQKKDRRDTDELNQIMITECQQLLRLFGLPYITAPMEAEAQCAELVSLNLVDGIVTDDSDVFLFGGTRVYKNMFNQSKFVECYLSNDLEKEYALDRRKLIQIAHLLGSDYTEGISGVGPVTALEIVTEFNNLDEFRDWWTQVQMGIEVPNDAHLTFRKKFRKNASKLFLPPSFPDSHVDTAYLEPEVDSDPSAFQWGIPDLEGLRNFLVATIGWSQAQTDEVLVPVIRDMNRREQEGTQANITHFISGGLGVGAFAPRVRSGGKGRMEKAFGRLRQEAENRKRTSHVEVDATDDMTTIEQQAVPRPSNKRKRTAKKKTGEIPPRESYSI